MGEVWKLPTSELPKIMGRRMMSPVDEHSPFRLVQA